MNRADQTMKPENNIEMILFRLPKSCGCNICNESKKLAKNHLPKKRYKKLCVHLGLQYQ